MFCHLHEKQSTEPLEFLKCFGIIKQRTRCYLNLRIEQHEFCSLHRRYVSEPLKGDNPEQKITDKTCWIVETANGDKQGIFTSLEKTEIYSRELQRTRNDEIIYIQAINHRKDYALTKHLSFLKVNVLISLINEFVGVGFLFITLKNNRIITISSYPYADQSKRVEIDKFFYNS